MKYAKIALTLLLCSSPFVGDYVVFKSKFSSSQVFRAFSDSIVHAIIGFLSSLVFFSQETSVMGYAKLYNVILCTLISSFIDVDHVFVARSLQWKDLTTLKQRGIFHCTTFWLFVTTVLLIYSYAYKKLNIYILSWMLIVAYTSHHIRDANRRGIWLYPYGHTPPLSKYVYAGLTTMLPHVFGLVCRYYRSMLLKDSTVEYMLV
ncbi:transmembrane protein 267 [Choristoneura fumiferana]|uniref:transmembrane protein 267 n=1 Tax=Choristoneura fumiferana TaxID=7141 RepID=UPI003D15ED2A